MEHLLHTRSYRIHSHSQPSDHSGGAVINPVLEMWRQKLCAHLPLAQVTLLREEKLVLPTLVMIPRLRPWLKGQGGSVWAGGTTEGRE